MSSSENNFWQEIQKEISETDVPTIATVGYSNQNQGYYTPQNSADNTVNSMPQSRLPFNEQNENYYNENTNQTPSMSSQMLGQDNILAILQNNVGYYVVCDFLIGTDGLYTKEGILYSAGVNFLTLFNPQNRTYTVCDIYSLKFITFYNSKTVPPDRLTARTTSSRQTNSKNSRRMY